MRKPSFADNSPRLIEHAGLVGFAGPVNADIEPVLIFHCSTSRSSRPPLMPRRPCTGAHGATPHWTCTNDRPRRGAGPPQATRSAGGVKALPAKRPSCNRSSLSPSRRISEEGVVHKAHRLWDPSNNPACGLVDNASFFFFQNPVHRPLGMFRKVQGCGPRMDRSPRDQMVLQRTVPRTSIYRDCFLSVKADGRLHRRIRTTDIRPPRPHGGSPTQSTKASQRV